jgi:hypothetical protein
LGHAADNAADLKGLCSALATPHVLLNVTYAQHFVGNFGTVYPALHVRQDRLSGAPIPFGVVCTLMPGCDTILDMWADCPGR